MSKPDDEAAGFLSRWSRRKAQVHQGGAQPPETSAPQRVGLSTALAAGTQQPAAPAALGATGVGAATAAASAPQQPMADAALAADARAASAAAPTPAAGCAELATAPKPTLQDVEQLNAKSDYRSFVARDVDPEVRNAAFKKLFHSDPHFNVMDGLDVYIDDYNTPNPLPLAIMKTLVQARAMGLIDDELKEQDRPHSGKDLGEDSGEGAGAGEGSTEGTAEGASAGSTEGAGEGAGEPSAAPITAQEAKADTTEGPAAPPVLVEIKLVPDQASNDEPLSAVASTASVVRGTVVPFPRRPSSADPT